MKGHSCARYLPLGPALALALLPTLVAGCADRAADSRWKRLAEGFRPSDRGARTEVFAVHGGREATLTREGGGAWLEVELRREDWSRPAGRAEWLAPLWIRGRGAPPDGSPARRLSSAEVAYLPREVGRFLRDPELPQGTFQLRPARVALYLGEEKEPPERVRLGVFVGQGRAVGGTWRIQGEHFSGEGIPVWPGSYEEIRVEAEPGSVLRFTTCLEPALRAQESGQATFRVLADGEPVFEHVQPVHVEGSSLRHEVELPRSGRVRLRFEVAGPPAHAAFLAPCLGPGDIGSYGRRPWSGARPDLVVFQADTYRADNLAAYGGEEWIAPHVNAFAREGLVFSRAWSSSTYTLPAHASMFTGLHPRQAGVNGMESSLPEELVTVAEALAAAGYRTGAVTEDLFVSQRFGFDQGFAWFDEKRARLEETLVRAVDFLEADDGRPVFLFVQTYRAHTPYHVSAATRARLGARGAALAADFDTLRAEQKELGRKEQASEGDLARLAEIAVALEALYRGGAADLDRGFGDFLRELERLGLSESGHLLFTSDHGEAFGEHGAFYHGGPVYEELVRVPLVLRGPGIRPGTVERSATLLDLPRTLAELAGVEPHPGWLGASLISLAEDRPVYTFQCKSDLVRTHSAFGVVDGDRKVIGLEELSSGELDLLGAYDLGTDAGELEDLVGRASWPRELLERHTGALRDGTTPRTAERRAGIDEETMIELRAMGYGGEE